MLNSEITKLDSVVGPQRSIYWQRQTGKGVLGKAPLWRAAPCPSSLGVSEQQMRSHRGKRLVNNRGGEWGAQGGGKGCNPGTVCSVWRPWAGSWPRVLSLGLRTWVRPPGCKGTKPEALESLSQQAEPKPCNLAKLLWALARQEPKPVWCCQGLGDFVALRHPRCLLGRSLNVTKARSPLYCAAHEAQFPRIPLYNEYPQETQALGNASYYHSLC